MNHPGHDGRKTREDRQDKLAAMPELHRYLWTCWKEN